MKVDKNTFLQDMVYHGLMAILIAIGVLIQFIKIIEYRHLTSGKVVTRSFAMVSESSALAFERNGLIDSVINYFAGIWWRGSWNLWLHCLGHL